MSDLFNNVKPGDTVHYKTPQGQHDKGKVVLRYDTHVVVNRGRGQPQVVNDKNYVKHERGGKVVGALLSRLAKEDTHDAEGRSARIAKTKRMIKRKKLHELINRHGYEEPLKKHADSEEAKHAGWHPHMAEAASDRAADRAYFADKEKRRDKAISNRNRKADWQESHPEHFKAHQKRVRHAKQLKDMIDNITGDMSSAVSKRQGKRLDDKSHAKILAKLEKLRESNNLPEAVGDGPNYYNVHIKDKHLDSAIDKLKLAGVKHKVHAKDKNSGSSTRVSFKSRKGLDATKGMRMTEARNEYDANIHMAQSAGRVSKPAKGHYLMRDGRRLSGPHTPDEAVKQYKGMSDSKGVKIVHVKEDVEVDVTAILMEGAGAMAVASLMNQKKTGQDKVKKAAQKAISLAKKAKGNKHVDTEPKLDIQDKGTGGPMETNQEGENHAKL